MSTNTTEEEKKNEETAEQAEAEIVKMDEEAERDQQEVAGNNEVAPSLLPLQGYPVDRRFSELPLRCDIVSALLDKGYRAATRIQQAIIENCSAGNDWWLSVNLSSNRTIAFGAYFCEKAATEKGKTSVLILSSVPEVRRNFASDIQDLAMFTELKILSLRNNLDPSQHIVIAEKPNIIIASPQDIVLLIAQNQLDLREISLCYLDEAEKLFRSQKQSTIDVLRQLSTAQWVVQSSYDKIELREELEGLREHLQPVRFSKQTEALSSSFWILEEEGLLENIALLLQGDIETNSLVLAPSREDVEQLALGLSRKGFYTDILCKDSHFKQKERALKKLQENKLQVLVATTDMQADLTSAKIQQIIVTSSMTGEWWEQLREGFRSAVSNVFAFGGQAPADEFSPHVLPTLDEVVEKQKRQLESILLQDGLRTGFSSYLEIVSELTQSPWGNELLAISLAEVAQKYRLERVELLEEMLRLEKKDLFFANRRKHHRGRKYSRKKR